MLNSTAYWILPDDEIINIGFHTHIEFVINNPKIFNLTKDKIISLYKKHGEHIPVEGQARYEIILVLLEQGFIRIRQYKTHWSISLKQWEKSQSILSKWAYVATNIKNAGRYMPVIINTLNGSKFNYTVEDLYLPII